MRAAVYYETGGPEVLRYEEVPDPELRPGGLLVEVAAVSIQGGDLLHRQGGVLATVPHVVGYQAAGIVRAVGEGVQGFTEGQPVVATMGYGSHAELVSVPARAAYAVPEGSTSSPRPACPSSSAPPTTACSSSATCSRASASWCRPGPAGSGWPPSSWPKRRVPP